jgi:hypothetical protein
MTDDQKERIARIDAALRAARNDAFEHRRGGRHALYDQLTMAVADLEALKTSLKTPQEETP